MEGQVLHRGRRSKVLQSKDTEWSSVHPVLLIEIPAQSKCVKYLNDEFSCFDPKHEFD